MPREADEPKPCFFPNINEVLAVENADRFDVSNEANEPKAVFCPNRDPINHETRKSQSLATRGHPEDNVF